MSELYTRPVLMSDISFFMSECEDSARNGHLLQEILIPKGNKVFEKQIRQVIKMNNSDQYTGHFILILVRQSDDMNVGFLWLCASQDLAGRSCVEIRVINIIKSMRGQGCGTLLLTVAIREYRHHVITAKCYPKSFQMSGILKRRGFEIMGTSERGSEFLCLEPK
ncbi:GNAT family N-acetyltransferase [Yersinia sp. 22-579]|uniref:GNAT family N-acetyltransferase n=1 Tax=Yersinia sp. 22-579 TaxID=3057580 RepID=UPI00263A45B4|nr:GNAT family N-acetyltransferase [Yersinia sp. 22-579]EKN6177461.1 GNAT family N-acetyltransferase [Yersinia enterocolitica]